MVERTVYVGSVLHVFVNLAHGERIQAWIPNDGDGAPFAQGTTVSVYFPHGRVAGASRCGNRAQR